MGIISILDFDVVILPSDIINIDNLFIDGCSLETFQNSLAIEIYVAPYNIMDLGNLR